MHAAWTGTSWRPPARLHGHEPRARLAGPLILLKGAAGEPRGRLLVATPQHRIERSQLVPLSVEEAFAFFADPFNLEALTPPWLGFRILTPRPIPMREGTTIEYVLTTHRVPIRWRTEIVEWEPGRRFVDRQSNGPFRLWEHTHAFEERPDGTRIRDTVLFRMPCGPLGAIAYRLLVARDLERIFDYRREAVERLLGGRPSALAPAGSGG